MEVAFAIVVGAVAGAASGYVMKADSVPEQGRVWFLAGILAGALAILGGTAAATTGPEEFILKNLGKVGGIALIPAVFTGFVAYDLTAKAQDKHGPPG